MAYQKKSYKKFVATAASATLVASAIVPVASAAPFSDVEETHEFATYIDAAVKAGYLKGYEDGTFGINDNLKRSHVVLIIGRYLESLGQSSEATTSPWSDVTDADLIKYGNIVKDSGVFTGYTDGTLKGNEFITRENMAVVLDRLAKKVTGTSLSEVAEKIEDVKVADLATANAAYQASIQALCDLGISTVENFNPKGNLKRGQFAKFIMTAVEKINEIAVIELEIESVSAINDSLINVTFNTEVKDIEVSDVTITETTSGNKVYVKSVKASEDNKSVEIELYDELVSGKTYEVAVKAGEEVVKGQLNFVIGEAAEIVVEDQVISTTSDRKLDYTVLNADGVDITEYVTVAVESNSSAFEATKGAVTVNLEAGKSAFVELKVTKKDETVVSSKRVKVTVQAPKATEFGENWTLYTGTEKPTEAFYKAENYKQDSTLNLKSTETLDIELVDQFGKRFANENSVRYESLDTAVAVVDAVTGKVTPRKEGKALVKASLMDGSTVVATKVVELTVAEEAKLAGITTDKEVVNAVTTAGLTEKVDVRLVDQFGNVIAGDLKVEVADTKIATVSYDATDKDGQVELTVTGKKEGSTTVKLTAGTFTKTVEINVAEAGEVADYKVEGVKSELLVKDVASTTDVEENKMTFSVKAVDANGLTTSVVKNPTVIVKDKDGKVVADKASVNTTTGKVTINALATDVEKGPFTLEVKVGSLTVLSTTYTVTDNRQAPEYQVKSNKVTLTSTTTLNDLFNGTVLDFGSTDVTVTDVDFVSNNGAVIEDADTKDEQGLVTSNDGSASIYVDTVTVAVGEDTFVLDLEGLKVDVTVDVTVPVITEATLTGNHSQLVVNFKTSEEIDLTNASQGNVIISYLVKDEQGNYVEKKQKNKFWSGYLNVGTDKYAPGIEGVTPDYNSEYGAVLPKNQLVSTAMNNPNWVTQEQLDNGALKVVLTVIDNHGNEKVQELNLTN